MTSTDSYLDELAAEGVDTHDGLARVLGNHAFYLQLLEGFHARHQDAAGRIRTALDQADRHSAERLAHTLKGAAGTIGAIALQELAGALEEQLRRGAESAARMSLERLERELLRVMALLSRMPRQAETSSYLPVSQAEPARDIIRRFARMLERGDAEATDMLSECADALTAVLGADAYRSIAVAVKEYEFDAALDLLRVGTKAAGDGIA